MLTQQSAAVESVVCSLAAAGPSGRRCLAISGVIQLCFAVSSSFSVTCVTRATVSGRRIVSRAFNIEASAWRTLEWADVGDCTTGLCCCKTGAVVVTLLIVGIEDRPRLRSLRPGCAEGWVPIPDPPVDVFSSEYVPSLCCVEGAVYVVGGADESSQMSNALQKFKLSTRAWTVSPPVPDAIAASACVEIAGRLYFVDDDYDAVASVFSYDPRTDQWRFESSLPLQDK